MYAYYMFMVEKLVLFDKLLPRELTICKVGKKIRVRPPYVYSSSMWC